jgi:hypothetical protein
MAAVAVHASRDMPSALCYRHCESELSSKAPTYIALVDGSDVASSPHDKLLHASPLVCSQCLSGEGR